MLAVGLALLALAASGRPAAAQRGTRAGHELTLIQPGEGAAARWRQRLTQPDMEAREEAFGQLVVAARRSPTLALALETWAADRSAPELAWTSRLALRELELADASGPGLQVHWLSTAHVTPLSPEVLQILHQQQLARAPRPTGASPEARGNPLRSLSVPGQGPFGEASGLSLLGPREFVLPVGGPRLRRLYTYELEVQSEGVSLTVREKSSRGVEERVYGSATLELLLEEHPELRDTVPDLAGLLAQQLEVGIYRQWRAETEVADGPRPRGQGPAIAQSVPRPVVALRTTSILGVKCTPLSSVPGSVGLLGPGVGLVIERRLPGTIASELGLRRGEILVELNGEQLCSVDEISRIIEHAAGGRLELKILDLDGLERSLTWTPVEREAEDGPR